MFKERGMVVCIAPDSFNHLRQNGLYEVTDSDSCGMIRLRGVDDWWDASRFDLYDSSETTKKPLAGPNAEQVGGTHYQGTSIQPWDFIIANQLGFLEGSIIKYVARFKRKGGLEDLQKAKHFLDKLIEETESSAVSTEQSF